MNYRAVAFVLVLLSSTGLTQDSVRSGKRPLPKAHPRLFGSAEQILQLSRAKPGIWATVLRTAVRRKVIAFKTYVNTLVHEFMHHYDHQRLQLGASYHTRGFYQRVGDLVAQLVPANA